MPPQARNTRNRQEMPAAEPVRLTPPPPKSPSREEPDVVPEAPVQVTPTQPSADEPHPAAQPAPVAEKPIAIPTETPATSPDNGRRVLPAMTGVVTPRQAGTSSVDAMLADPVGAFVGDIDPDVDFKPFGTRIPRYYDAALELQARATNRTKQDVLIDALRSHIDPRLFDAAYQRLYHARRPREGE